MKSLLICLALVAGSFCTSPARAVVRLSVQQVGGDVVVTGSGSANTSALTSQGTDTGFTNVLTDTQIYAGHSAFGDGQVSLWSGLTGPGAFGGGNVFANPDTGIGSLFGIIVDNFQGIPGAQALVLPLAYTSGANLSSTSTFTGKTLAELGFTPGTFTWSWGSGATADSLQLEVPVPAPLPMAGAAVVFTRLRRLRRLSRRLHT